MAHDVSARTISVSYESECQKPTWDLTRATETLLSGRVDWQKCHTVVTAEAEASLSAASETPPSSEFRLDLIKYGLADCESEVLRED